MSDGTCAVIPVKSFVSAKRRLTPILNSFERARLARLMLEDVLDAVRAASSISGFLIVTADRDAAALARSAGGRVLAETGEFGVTSAVGAALAALRGRDCGVAVIPADLPHIPSSTIDTAAQMTPEHGVTLVPAICDGGTNLLVMRPAGIVPPLFGPDSFRSHRMAALQAGIIPQLQACPMAGHDIDRPRDLITCLRMGAPTRTRDFVEGLDIPARIAFLDGMAAHGYAKASA
jgi:2-phospho-L-lactate guanylyltransferase